MHKTTLSNVLFAGLSLAMLLAPTVSQAQMEVGVMGVYQNGKEVGRIYVPARGAKDETYAEHWVLYSDYVYPSKHRMGLETVIVPLDERVESLAAFKKGLAAEAGAKYIDVLSHESKLK